MPVKVKKQLSVIVIFSSSCLYLSISFMISQFTWLAYFIISLRIPLWKIIFTDDINILNVRDRDFSLLGLIALFS